MSIDPDEQAANQRLGTELAGFWLERILGIGGMAAVFLGRRADGVLAAVKTLHPSLRDVDEVKKRFLREGPIGTALAAVGPLCDGLPQVWASGIAEDGTAYMIMEVLDGETSFDRLARRGVLPPEEVLWLAHKALDVLVVAHAYGVVHRDLKPENLFITRDGRLKVLDFGVARVLDEAPASARAFPEKTITRTGTKIGSGEYMAPEQARGQIRAIDGRTDVFGLGATMHRLLTGKPLHGDLVDAALLVAAATEAAPPLASFAPHLPPWLSAVVDRALTFSQEQRYPDAATMRFDVYALRQNREPPYVAAVARGQLRPGERMSTR